MPKFPKIPPTYSVILLIAFIAGLYFLQNKGIIPMVMKVVESDLFFIKDDEEEELGKVDTERTRQAEIHCKNTMKEEKKVPDTAQFNDSDYEAWALGGKTYVIRSHVLVSGENGAAVDRKYACKIQFNGGDIADIGNWTLLGIDFHAPSGG
jgi:hypothetical protein